MNPKDNIKFLVWVSGQFYIFIHTFAIMIYLTLDGFIAISIISYIKNWAIISTSLWGIIVTVILLNLLEYYGNVT